MSAAHPAPVDLLRDARRTLLSALKHAGRSTIPQLAEALSVSTEAVRQQLTVLQRQGWVIADCGPDDADGRVPGRPPAEYCLASVADVLFPKNYAALATAFFDELPDARDTLARVADGTVNAVRSMEASDSVEDRIDALRSIYRPNDPYTEVEANERGYRLIERNCPYLQFAAERPEFCSTSVSALRRLMNAEVVREERFQDNDGRCVFHIYTDAPVSAARRKVRVEAEPPKNFVPPPRMDRTRR